MSKPVHKRGRLQSSSFVVFSLQSAPGIASNIRTRPLFRRTFQAGELFGQGRLLHLAPVYSPCTCTSSQSRGLRLLQERRMQRTMGTTSNVATWATERLVADTAPAGCRVAAGNTSRIMGIGAGFITQFATHTGAVESITGTSVTIPRNWLKEGVHDVGCCGRIAGRDKHPNFLVRGSCQVHRWRVPLLHPFPSL